MAQSFEDNNIFEDDAPAVGSGLTEIEKYYLSKGLVSIATQTIKSSFTYTSEASTSTLTLQKQVRHKNIQVEILDEKKRKKCVKVQFPTPKKKCYNLSRTLSESNIQLSNSDSDTWDEESSESSGIEGVSDLCGDDSIYNVEISDFRVGGDILKTGVKGDVVVNSKVVGDVTLGVSGDMGDEYGVNSLIVNNECVNSELISVNNEYIEFEDESSSSESDDSECYEPSTVDESTEASDMDNTEIVSEKVRLRNERTFLIYETKLFDLLNFCQNVEVMLIKHSSMKFKIQDHNYI